MRIWSFICWAQSPAAFCRVNKIMHMQIQCGCASKHPLWVLQTTNTFQIDGAGGRKLANILGFMGFIVIRSWMIYTLPIISVRERTIEHLVAEVARKRYLMVGWVYWLSYLAIRSRSISETCDGCVYRWNVVMQDRLFVKSAVRRNQESSSRHIYPSIQSWVIISYQRRQVMPGRREDADIMKNLLRE
jgi:hypothetical protein